MHHYNSDTTANVLRPKSFSELAGQEFVVNTILSSLEQGHTAHAYLFCGPRGVGKTSAARLLALAINRPEGTSLDNLEYEGSKDIRAGKALDVIEIDGASYTSVENIRSIREELLYKPVQFPYKVYIIDEVHMLSNSAFNALLKTIEEPPEYVIFVFATTEFHKVPATIRSRCQQFIFKKISISQIEKKLHNVCRLQNISAESDALRWLSKEADGSLRDAYTLFDQVASFSHGNISLEKIRKNMGLAGLDTLNTLFLYCVNSQKEDVLNFISELFERGISAEQILFEACEYVRNILLIKAGIDNSDILGYAASQFEKRVHENLAEYQIEYMLTLLLNCYRNLKYTVQQRFELDITFAQLCSISSYVPQEELIKRLESLRMSNDDIQSNVDVGAVNQKSEVVNFEESDVDSSLSLEEDIEDSEQIDTDNVSQDTSQKWNEILSEVQNKDEKLGLLLDGAVIQFFQDKLAINFSETFPYEYVKKEKQILLDVIVNVLGAHWDVEFNLTKKQNTFANGEPEKELTQLDIETKNAQEEGKRNKEAKEILAEEEKEMLDIFGATSKDIEIE